VGKRQFGTVRKLPSGRWQARSLTLDGRLVPAKTTFPTKADATLWLDSIRTQLAMGLDLDPSRSRVALEEFAERWLEHRVGLSPRTREIYEAQLRLHILPAIVPGVPALGRVALCDLSPDLIRRWYRVLADQRSPATAAKGYVRLRQILNRAVDDDLLVKNPCRIERGGVEHHAEQRFATMEELVALADAVIDRYRALILTAGLAGLRQGELFALRRHDLALDAGIIHVRRKRLRLASGQVIEDAPKSAAGRRTVALPEPLTGELRRHLDNYVDAPDSSFVFTTADGCSMERSNFRHRIWLPACETVGLQGLRFHDLRHTAGTLAARTGATTKELMARLGHASSQAAMIYQHAAEDRDRRIAEGLAEMAREAGLGGTIDSRVSITSTGGPAPSDT